MDLSTSRGVTAHRARLPERLPARAGMACSFLALRSGAMSKSAPTIRCAIYTRKSTEEGLDQEFNSLHAQREAGEAYIKSQKEAGWKALPDHYDDGGFSGGNLDRLALQRLLADIEA